MTYMDVFWVTLLVFGIIFCMFLANLLLSIVNAGKRDFDEARQLQGSVSDVWNGRVHPNYEATNDPRLIEGMEGEDGLKRFHHQNRTSDDYLKSIFGA